MRLLRRSTTVTGPCETGARRLCKRAHNKLNAEPHPNQRSSTLVPTRARSQQQRASLTMATSLTGTRGYSSVGLVQTVITKGTCFWMTS